MSRKKRPSSRPRSRRDRDQSPESKAIKKEMNLKKKEHGGGKRKSKGKKERFIKEELTGTVSMTREGYGFVEVPDRDNDVFVPQHKMRGALNGDIVKVLTTKASVSRARSSLCLSVLPSLISGCCRYPAARPG